ncbi:MAG: 3-hydroxypropanoate dehydrogenase [bacterium]
MTTPSASSAHEALVLAPDAQALLFTEARTANAFTQEPVLDSQLQAIFALSKWPPTTANTNPLRWLIARSPAAKQRLDPLMAEGNREKTRSAPLTVVLAANIDFHEDIPRLIPVKPELRDYFAADAAAREVTARNNAWLQAGYFILAVRAAGLAAGPMLGFDAAGVDDEFFDGTSWRSILVVNIGKPAAEGAWFDRLPRLEYGEVTREV